MAAAEVEDDDALTYDDEDAAAWYAAAAAAEGEGDDEEVEEVAEETEDGAAAEVLDPYQVVDDEVVAIDDDPYLVSTQPPAAEVDPYLVAAADPYLEGEPPRKAQKTQAQAQTSRLAAPPVASTGVALNAVKEAAPAAGAAVRPPPPAPPMPDLPAADGGIIAEDGGVPLAAPVEPPAFDGVPGEEIDLKAAPPEASVEPVPELGAQGEVGTEGEADVIEGSITWDERVVVVRQGQVHIELQHQNPPMHDEHLLRFCDWLDEQMPIVVQNFPYVRKSGAHIDLSDNVIGPEGLDKLFRVLRDHRVPCTVIKAYRNLLNDTIVDTLIEYLYTQPESFPMHGIHISHNKITDKGAFRLIRAAAQCGHYPRLTSRLPLWLRLECNDIQSPQKLINDCLKEEFNVCLMKDGLCSRPTCNHYSGVHVQLPYFFHQHGKAPPQMRQAPQQPRAIPPVLVAPPPHMAGMLPAGVEMQLPKADPDAAADPAPDWMREAKKPSSFRAVAPKRLPAPTTAQSAPSPPPGDLAAAPLLQPRRPTPPPSAAVPSVSPELAALLAPGAPVPPAPVAPVAPPPLQQLAQPVSEFGYAPPQLPQRPPPPAGPTQSSVFRARRISDGAAEGRVPSSFAGSGNAYMEAAPQAAPPEYAQAGKGSWGGGGGGWGGKGNNGGWGGKGGSGGGWGGKGGGKGDKGDDLKCYNCGGFGHMSRECPEPQRGYGGGGGGGRDRDSRGQECFNCGGFDHLARDCPEPRKGKGKGKGKDRGDMQCYNCKGFGHGSRDCPEPPRKGGGKGRRRDDDDDDFDD
mmetsp:Transcript_44604/g.113478  ORF Transcript_44604/g.113478 Transcript_44604/m.113478 type:complete len:796 (-) Transcript_44604:58-2445(-)